MRSRLAAIWRRAEGWLRREAYVREAVTAAAQRGFQDGYQVGRAHGEIIRQALANEIEFMLGEHRGIETLTPEDVGGLAARQLH